MKKTILASVLALVSFNVLADASIPNVKGKMKVTANVDAGCEISGGNIDFGVLQMPISTQYASGNITLKCSNKTNLTLDVLYNTGDESYVSPYTVKYANSSTTTAYHIYKDGKKIENHLADVECWADNKVVFANKKISALFGAPSTTPNYTPVKDEWNVCNSNRNVTDQRMSIVGLNANGVLTGISKGEQVKFNLEVPNSNGLNWAKGYNSYKIVANGQNQDVTMKAVISPTNNPTYRMTPDSYASTIFVLLSY